MFFNMSIRFSPVTFRPFMAKVFIKLMTIHGCAYFMLLHLIKTLAMKGRNATGENLMLMLKNKSYFEEIK